MISEFNLRAVRPGLGISPKFLSELMGRKFNRDLARGTPMSIDFVE